MALRLKSAEAVNPNSESDVYGLGHHYFYEDGDVRNMPEYTLVQVEAKVGGVLRNDAERVSLRKLWLNKFTPSRPTKSKRKNTW